MNWPLRRRGRGPIAVLVASVLLVLGVGVSAGIALLGAPSAPDNDSFAAGATVDLRIEGTTQGAAADTDEVANGIGEADQAVVWYRWKPNVSGWAYITPAGAANPTMPIVKAYLGSAINNLEQVDQSPTGSGQQGASIPAVAGQTYHLAVIDSGGGEAFDLVISQPSAIGAVNDRPDGAVDAAASVARATEKGTAQTVAIDTLSGATADPDEPANGGSPAQRSLWYSWTPNSNGTAATFSAAPVYGADGPLRVAVYRLADNDTTPGLEVGDLVPVSGGETGGPFVPLANTTYLIAVDGPPSFFRLAVTSTGVAVNDDTTAPVVDCAAPHSGWSSDEILSVACTASDVGAGLAQPGDANFTAVTRSASGAESAELEIPSRAVCDLAGNCTTVGPWSGLKADRKAPSVTCETVDSAWTTTTPSVTCEASDGGAGLAVPSDSSRRLIATVSPNSEGKVSIDAVDICDEVGNCTTVGPFGPTGVDTKAPVISCAELPTEPSSVQVSIDCTATDRGVGLAQPESSSFSLTTEVKAGEASNNAATGSREVCDALGNCATAGPFTGIVVDLAPPSVTCRPDDEKALDAWRSGPFTITCSIADRGTGLAPATPSSVTLGATVANGSASSAVTAVASIEQVCDLAGSCVPVGPIRALRIDRQAPTVACEPAGDGWFNKQASVSCAVDDGSGSGIEGPSSVTVSASAPDGQEGSYDTGTAEVCDRVGHCTSAGPVTELKIDAKAPRVQCEAPASKYRIEARIRCTASDGGSGLADPADRSFILSTSVGVGKRDANAQTSSRRVCDVAGMCTTAEPITVSVDLTGDGGDGPRMDLPSRITVLSAYESSAPISVPYALPEAPGATEIACLARPGTVFGLGWSTVVCEAINNDGTTNGSFPLVLKALSTLAPSGVANPDGAWRGVGVGFDPGSSVQVRIDGTVVGRGTASNDGRASIEFAVPGDLPSGDHQLVIAGLDPDGDPVLNVSPLAVVAAEPGTEPPVLPPVGAPELPSQGPVVPADPGPSPAPPDLGDLSPENYASTTTIPSSTTVPVQLPPGGSETASGSNGSNGSHGSAPSTKSDSDNGAGIGFGVLPRTGAGVALWLVIASALIGAGTVLLRSRRRDAAVSAGTQSDM